MKHLLLAISMFGLLSGCSWEMPEFLSFGSSGDGISATGDGGFDPTVLLPTFSDARLEPIEEGVVLRVTGIAPIQGYHSAILVQVEGTSSILRFQVRALAPTLASPQSARRRQQLLVARILTFSELAGVQRVEVISGERTVQLRNR